MGMARAALVVTIPHLEAEVRRCAPLDSAGARTALVNGIERARHIIFQFSKECYS
jgi:hypothetical protein